MSLACCSQGEPVSWLRLERFALGELADEERGAIAAHLEGCPACRGCLAQLQAPVRLRPLVLDGGLASARAPHRPRRRSPARIALVATLAAAAAVAALILSTRLLEHAVPERGLPGSRIGVKGGELALVLVRERGGRTLVGATSYAPGDRLKALVTSPCGERPLRHELVVVEGHERSFPLARATLACGNQVPLEGAFALTGREPVAVCVVAVEGEPPARRALAGGAALPTGATVCVELAPER